MEEAFGCQKAVLQADAHHECGTDAVVGKPHFCPGMQDFTVARVTKADRIPLNKME
jgi:hypothetical protein